MRDFPVFTTEYGVSGLVLHEIPYRQIAYIRLRSVQEGGLWEHLQECAQFCRAAGAKRIFVGDYPGLEGLPLHSAVFQMTGKANPEPAMVANLFPVTDATASYWREIYNDRMSGVDHARTLERLDEGELTQSPGTYFVHRDGTLLGIGWLDGGKLLAMAAAVPGAGKTVMHTLMSLVEGERMTLEVASTNARAIALYEKLGFCRTAVLRNWYRME